MVLSQIYSELSAHNFVKVRSDLTFLSHIVQWFTFFPDTVYIVMFSFSEEILPFDLLCRWQHANGWHMDHV